MSALRQIQRRPVFTARFEQAGILSANPEPKAVSSAGGQHGN
jgi:hypothetical protein